MTFNGFISYSHAADGRLAPAVQRGLHRLAKPWHRRRALWIFRDQTGLSVTPALWSSIQEALDGSDYFVLLASPEAAGSPWVNREIEHWTATKPADRILPVVTDGEWEWDQAAGDFTPDSTSVPDALRGVFAEEPLFLDLRWARGDEHLSLQHSRFRDAIAQLAAPMHGVSKDELEGEDVRQHRRVRRLRSGALATLAVLLLVAAMTGFSAVRNADLARDAAAEALRQEQVADEQRGSAASFAAEAKRQQTLALAEQKRASDASALAREQEELAKDQQMLADLASAEARRQQGLAGDAARRTERQRKLAQEQGERAKRLSEKADELAAEAQRQAQLAKDEQKRAHDAAAEAQKQQANAAQQKAEAERQAANAEQQQAIAEQQQRVAVSRRLLNQAKAKIVDDPPTALMLSAAAQSVQAGPETRTGAAGVVAGTRWAGALADSLSATYLPDGTLVSVAADRSASLWDVRDRRRPVRLATLPTATRSMTGAVRSGDGGRMLATVESGTSNNSWVTLWDVSDRRVPKGFWQTGTRVAAVALSPDGRSMVISEFGGRMTFHRITGRQVKQVWTYQRSNQNRLDQIMFSSDSRRLLGLDGADLLVFDMADPAAPAVLDSQDGHAIKVMATSPATPFAAIGNTSGSVVDLDSLTTGESDLPGLTIDLPVPGPPTTPGEQGAILDGLDFFEQFAFSPDGNTLAALGRGRKVVVWDLSNLDVLPVVATLQPGGPVASMTLSPDGATLVTAEASGTTTLWDVAGQGRLGRAAALPRPDEKATSVRFGPDGRALAVAGVNGSAAVWDVTDPASPVRRAAPVVHPGPVTLSALSADLRTAVAVGTDGRITVTDLTDPKRPAVLATAAANGRKLRALTISPDGTTLAAIDRSRRLVLWDLTDRRVLAPLADLDVGEALDFDLAFSPDGRTMITAGSGRTALLWDVSDRARPVRLTALKGHGGPVEVVAFSPDGGTLATGGADGVTIVWDVTDRTRIRRLTSLAGSSGSSAAFDPAGRLLATADFAGVAVWDLSQPELPVQLAQTSLAADQNTARTAFSPDGRTLAIVSDSLFLDETGRVELWDYAGLNELRADPAAAVCEITGRGLTADEWRHFVPEFPYRDFCAT